MMNRHNELVRQLFRLGALMFGLLVATAMAIPPPVGGPTGLPTHAPSGSVRGIVAAACGGPVPSVVYLSGNRSYTDATGAFLITNVPPGTYTLIAQQTGNPGITASSQVSVQPAAIADVGTIRYTASLQADPTNCGSCGTRCQAFEICSSGACKSVGTPVQCSPPPPVAGGPPNPGGGGVSCACGPPQGTGGAGGSCAPSCGGGSCVCSPPQGVVGASSAGACPVIAIPIP
jgi:hypothetical protein